MGADAEQPGPAEGGGTLRVAVPEEFFDDGPTVGTVARTHRGPTAEVALDLSLSVIGTSSGLVTLVVARHEMRELASRLARWVTRRPRESETTDNEVKLVVSGPSGEQEITIPIESDVDVEHLAGVLSAMSGPRGD